MSDVFSFHQGDGPLLVSVPHDGTHVPPEILERMTQAGRSLPDTDWHVAELYSFVRELGASLLVANYSRYVVDLNRSAADEVLYPGQVATGLCPGKTFAGEDIYIAGGIDEEDVSGRVERYWRPYHKQLESALDGIRRRHGHALLWDAHSIASVVPRLFSGELAELNLGTNGGLSCDPGLEAAVAEQAAVSPYDSVLNGRFQGGFITRHYGDPDQHIHAMQLEIAQRAYMDEANATFDAPKATRLRGTLRHMLETYIRQAG